MGRVDEADIIPNLVLLYLLYGVGIPNFISYKDLNTTHVDRILGNAIYPVPFGDAGSRHGLSVSLMVKVRHLGLVIPATNPAAASTMSARNKAANSSRTIIPNLSKSKPGGKSAAPSFRYRRNSLSIVR